MEDPFQAVVPCQGGEILLEACQGVELLLGEVLLDHRPLGVPLLLDHEAASFLGLVHQYHALVLSVRVSLLEQ